MVAVSVIMPVYNAATYVRESVNSILQQTFRDFEFIIIDDCSTDSTLSILREFDDPRIMLIHKEQNTGIVDSLNAGLQIAKGKFIARMDGDDIALQHRLEKQYGLMSADEDIVVCGSWFETFPDSCVHQMPETNDNILLHLLHHSAFAHPSVMFSKPFLEERGLKYEKVPHAEDYYLWALIAGEGKMYNIPEVLIRYRVHDDQVSEKYKGIQAESRMICQLTFFRRMFCELYNGRNPAILFGRKDIGSFTELKTFVSWCDKLVACNDRDQKLPAEGFREFITGRRFDIVRHYIFYGRNRLGVKNLNAYAALPGVMFDYFTFPEHLRFIGKCITAK